MNHATKRAIDAMLCPRSVAVVGASRSPSSVGYGVLKSLLSGGVLPGGMRKGFAGRVYAVNPHASRVLGKKCYRDVSEINDSIDLAVIAVPSSLVSSVAESCGKKGVRCIVVLSAGFAEVGEEGRARQQDLLSICRAYRMRLLGPNCLGVIRPSHRLNASFALASPSEGSVAFVTQSGALADSVIDWAIAARYSFSSIISLGNSADIDAADVLEWLGRDSTTKVIALYIEGLSNGRKFLSAAKRLRGKKPIVILKGGRTSEGVQAISSHTASLAGDYRVFVGAMKQAGVRMAESLEELFDLAKTLSEQVPLKKHSVAIVTNGGGAGVLCADYCAQYGLRLSRLSQKTLRALDASGVMHPAYSRRNPLDLVGDATAERYHVALHALLSQKDVGGLIVVQTLQTMTDPVADARVIVRARDQFPDKPIVCVFMGGKYSSAGIRVLAKHGVPDFNDPRKAVRSLAALGGLL